ncbi:MAG: zinc ribbon domain-containing protein [Ruminococcus sp.]|nr:zinc ribbon domain-containing protein [Ruminococcus sp.]
MAIFDDVVVNAKSAASAVSKKAGELYDLSKLRITLASLRSDLNKQYQALGEAVFTDAPEEEIDTIKAEITEVKQNILDVEKILVASRNYVKCPQCGQKLNKNASFCYTCGAAIPKEPNPVCAKCGAELVKGAAFCYKCGAKADEKAEETTEE